MSEIGGCKGRLEAITVCDISYIWSQKFYFIMEKSGNLKTGVATTTCKRNPHSCQLMKEAVLWDFLVILMFVFS